jgi:sugar lactone lactonase YvrE
MRRIITILSVAALLVVLAAAAAGPAGAWTVPAEPATVATFSAGDWGAFVESIAADDHGGLWVSRTVWGYYDDTTADSNIGQLWRIPPSGDPQLVASTDLSPYGMLCGVAVGRHGHVFVAVWDMGMGLTSNGVLRLDGDTLEQVVALPEGAWANGLAFHDRRLYIGDSAGGAVWRVKLGAGVASPQEPWLQVEALAPGTDETSGGLGINGIAFNGDVLYAVVSDFGRVVRVPVRRDGSAGKLTVITERPELVTADGIAFDIAGGLWIAVNSGTTGAWPSGALYRLTPGGALTTIADDTDWIDYPTQPVFGTTPGTRGTLFLADGAFYNFTDGSEAADVRALHVGIPGLPLR